MQASAVNSSLYLEKVAGLPGRDPQTQHRALIKKKISDIGEEPLKAMLGEHFDTIMDLNPIVPVATSPSTAMTEATSNAESSKLLAVKPPTEVYDLTIDSSDEDEPNSTRLGPHLENTAQSVNTSLISSSTSTQIEPSSSTSVHPLGPASSAKTNQSLTPKRNHSLISAPGDENAVMELDQAQQKRARIEKPTQVVTTAPAPPTEASVAALDGSETIV